MPPSHPFFRCPPTSNYHNILHSLSNHFILSGSIFYCPMVQYTEFEVNGALADIANRVSARDASKRWGVPRSTLQIRRLSWPARCKYRLTLGLRQRT
ncbi:transposase, partial [Colletotrichum incanum]